jgi:hypothetical protein
MSLTLTLQCPLHPNYQAKIAPVALCKACRLLFSVRNNTHRVLSVPREERTELDELIVKSVD